MKIKSIAVYAILTILFVASFVSFEGNRTQIVAQQSSDTSATSNRSPLVGISRGKDYAVATRQAVENAGGLGKLIKKGATVLIKPNICFLAEAGSQTITDYRSVAEVVNMAYEAGAKKVIIGEGAIVGNPFDGEHLRINKYDQIPNVELIDFGNLPDADLVALKPEQSNTGVELYVPKLYMEADVVITMPKMKTHTDGVVTLSLKNSIGIAPLSKYSGRSPWRIGLHDLGLPQAIVDLNLIRTPDFTIIEGIVAGEGQ